MVRPELAVFDFDGTITTRDTLLPFLRRVAGAPNTIAGLAAASTYLALSRFDRNQTHRGKEVLLKMTLRGLSVADLGGAADEYARFVTENLLRERVIDRIDFHAKRGHELVIVSAGLKAYVSVIGSMLGFGKTLATELEVDAGVVTGRISGANVNGEEKVRQLERYVATAGRDVYAYGNSSGDKPMLEWADRAFRVGRRGIRPI